MSADGLLVRLEVEHCTAPRESSASLRGSAEKYTEVCSKLVSAFEDAFSGRMRDVLINPTRDAQQPVTKKPQQQQYPRIGAFEVTLLLLNGGNVPCAPKQIIFSKLDARKWPSMRLLMAKIFAQVPLASDPLIERPLPLGPTTPHDAEDTATSSSTDVSQQRPPPHAEDSSQAAPVGNTAFVRKALRLPLRTALRELPVPAPQPSTTLRAPRPQSAPPGLSSCAPSKANLRLKRASFDQELLRRGVAQILAVGDCHGGRTICHLSNLVMQHFIYGTMHTLASGKRSLPPLHSLLLPSKQALAGMALPPAMDGENEGGGNGGAAGFDTAIVIFSYGTRDCRLHASKWQADVDTLCGSYVNAIKEYAAAGCARSARTVVPLILACPPAVDYHACKLDVETNGELSNRVQATECMNAAL